MSMRDWMIFATAVGTRVAFGIQFQSVGAVGPSFVDSLGITFVALGTLLGAYSFPGIAVALPGGWLISRMGDRRMVLIALSLMVLGSALMAVAPAYGLLLAGRVLSGIGNSLLSVVVPKIMLDHVPPQKLVGLMGTFIVGYPLGIALALSLLPLLPGWRSAMVASAFACCIALLSATATIPRPAAVAGAATVAFRLAPGTLAPLLLISAVWALANASFAIILGFAAPFFVAQGMSPVRAAAITSLNLYASLPITPLGGWLLKRTVGVLAGILLCLFGVTVATVLLPFGFSPPALMISYGVLIGIVAGPIFAQAGDGMRPEERALAMSILFTIFYMGMAVAPPIAGLARDMTGDPAMPFYVSALLMIATMPAQIAYAKWRSIESKQAIAIPNNCAD